MPWVPELFSAPALAKLEERQRQHVVDVPYFDGLVVGDVDALVRSFAGEPRLRHPLYGRVEGERPFRDFVAATERWLQDHDASVEDVHRSVLEERGFEEVVVHLDAGAGRVALPHGLVADHSPSGLIEELRIYFSTRTLTGRPTERRPLLRADPDLREPDAVAGYQRALSGGDVAAVLAAFEPDGWVRDPASADHIHRGAEDLRALYADRLSAGGIVLENCVLVEDGDTVAVEYNLRPGPGAPPRPGLTVYVCGEHGMLAGVRSYDD